jgi:hypothetical protein
MRAPSLDFAAASAADPLVRAAFAFGLRRGLGMALYRRGEVIGFHFACRRKRDHAFTAEQQRIAHGLGRLASIALQYRAALDAHAARAGGK